MSANPRVEVIGGPNGAGKTTISRRVLRRAIQIEEFVNADAIAAGLSEYHPENVAVAAGRLMLERLEELAGERRSFAFETTLSTRSFASKIANWIAAGYLLHLVYVWVPSSDVSVNRVAMRVRRGGHHVPEETIRRRYGRSLKNLFELYLPLAAEWEFLDNSQQTGETMIARGGMGLTTVVVQPELWINLESTYGARNKG